MNSSNLPNPRHLACATRCQNGHCAAACSKWNSLTLEGNALDQQRRIAELELSLSDAQRVKEETRQRADQLIAAGWEAANEAVAYAEALMRALWEIDGLAREACEEDEDPNAAYQTCQRIKEITLAARIDVLAKSTSEGPAIKPIDERERAISRAVKVLVDYARGLRDGGRSAESALAALNVARGADGEFYVALTEPFGEKP